MEGGRRLRDPLAVPAGELLADGLDDLPLARDDFQRLGDVLAELHDPPGAATDACRRRLDHHPLARQMLRKWLPAGGAGPENPHSPPCPRPPPLFGQLVFWG